MGGGVSVPDGYVCILIWVCPHPQIIPFLLFFLCFFFFSLSLSLIMPLNCILVTVGDSNLSEKQTVQGFGRVVFIQVLL